MELAKPRPIRVLLVEDQESEAFFIQRILKHSTGQSFSVVHSKSLSEAIEELGSDNFDVCLLDLGLPDGSGINSLHKIQSIDARIAVVVLTGNESEALGLTTIETGAQDFVAKQALSCQLLSRSLSFAIARQRKMLGYAADANTDVLTGMPNRRRLNESFSKMAETSERFCIALVDIDHFKLVNDTHGHLVGDLVLKHIGQLIQACTNDEVLSSRFGGEEFALLLPDTDIEETYRIACNLIKEIAESVLQIDDTQLRVTVSVGISPVQRGEALESTLKRTDVALYEAKQLGRNRVCVKH